MKQKIKYLLLSLSLNAAVLHAQNDIITIDKTFAPYFMVCSNSGSMTMLTLKSSLAKANVAAMVADITLTQVYKNETKDTLDIVYTFPASTNVSVSSLEIRTGNRKIISETRGKSKITSLFKQPKHTAQGYSFIESLSPNLLQLKITKVAPGSEVYAILKYYEILSMQEGKYSLNLPAPMEQHLIKKAIDDPSSLIQNDSTGEEMMVNKNKFDFAVSVSLSAGMSFQNITCESHAIKISYPSLTSAEIELDSTDMDGETRDFILQYQLGGNMADAGLLLFDNNDEKFFLLTVQPPTIIKKEDFNAREFIFLIDASPSMNGFPLELEKKLITKIVAGLRSSDKFNVIVFTGKPALLSENLLTASADNAEKAGKFIDTRNDSSKYDLPGCLQKAIELPSQNVDASRSLVIITDGYIPANPGLLDEIQTNLNKVNVHVVGVNTGLNIKVLNCLADVSMENPLLITTPEDAPALIEQYSKDILSPVMTHVKADFGRFSVYDIEPQSLPDLLINKAVVISGKYKGKPKDTITISGYANGRPYNIKFDVSKVQLDINNSALQFLWAKRKIDILNDYNNLKTDDKTIANLTDLGLKYKMVTPYTSFIATETSETPGNKGNPWGYKKELPMTITISNENIDVQFTPEDYDNVMTDDQSISKKLYKEIIFTGQSESLINDLQTEIETRMKNDVNPCLLSSSTFPDTVSVTITAKGKVNGVTPAGNNLNLAMTECLVKAIKAWDFSKYNNKKEWSFIIKFF